MEADMLNLKRALRGDERAFEALISRMPTQPIGWRCA